MSARLHLVPTHHVPGSITAPFARSAPADRLGLMRLCAGEPLLLTDDEVDLIALVNAAPDMDTPLLDPDEQDPDDFRLAEVLVEHLCQHYGVDRQANGDRMKGVESNDRRYLLPFLIELERHPPRRPARRRPPAHQPPSVAAPGARRRQAASRRHRSRRPPRPPHAPRSAELGALEDTIEQLDPATYNSLLGSWLQADQDQLQAHLTGTEDTCADCAQARTEHHRTA